MKTYKVNEFTELDFEYRLREVYGERIYHNYSLSRFRVECKNLAKTIRRAINLNIETDGFHRSRLDVFLDKLDNSFKDKDFEPGYILALIKILFLLLGDEPNNWRVQKISQDIHLTLSGSRNLVYTQSLRQKANLILRAHEFSPYCDVMKRSELIRAYMEDSNSRWNSKSFVQWYKKKFPKLFLEIF